MPFRSASLAVLLALLGTPAHGEDAACAQLEVTHEPVPEDQNGKVVLTADRAVVLEEGVSVLSGSVRLTQGDRQFSAEAVEFDRDAGRVSIHAESLFRNSDLIVRSQRSEIDLAKETARFYETDFTVPDRAARGEAQEVSLTSSGRATMEEVSYTTCAPGNAAWLLKANMIRLDPEEGMGMARHARLSFGRVPILYLPYFEFPIDGRRRTGFLFPTLGNSDETGLDFQWPYYLNLAPNYDATLTPRHMGRRGQQLASQVRYLLPSRYGKGAIEYEYLDHDEVTDTRRSLLEYHHEGLINNRLALEARFAEVSDPAYFEDLGGRLEAAATTHLERSAQLTYVTPVSYSITAMVQDYQTLDPTLPASAEPFKRLPLIRLDWLTRRSLAGMRLGFSGEFVNFERGPEEAQRVDLQPFLRLLYDNTAWYVQAQADYRHTVYRLDDRERERQVPIFSAESGLRFERQTDSGALQTMEPRLFWLYVPFREQGDIPVFDSGEPDFDIVQLFARNRFSGEDRIADAHHIATAFTTRLLNPEDGMVRLAATIGQIYRLQEPRVVLNGTLPPDKGGTDVIGSLDYRLSPTWSAAFSTQWSPTENRLNRNGLQLRYRDARRFLSVGYRYRRDAIALLTERINLEQADLILNTPIYGSWKLLGRWRYSLEGHQSLETLGGVAYDTCCWAVRTAYRRYIANTEGEFSTGVYLQLELKGLSRIGAGIDDLDPLAD